ncbi:hypothetical protein DH2020_007751 [Rehmannia glutinosa]|uniref:Putative plant transposon protein domain-containing protein n=1 Tax=Rehmannia glutinosa TaxID=99300 RepID=A0ABR0TZQ0_REHGL
MGQLATAISSQQKKENFPSNTEVNPREHCKAIKLRSGTEYDGPEMPNHATSETKANSEIFHKEEIIDKESEIEKPEDVCFVSRLNKFKERGFLPSPEDGELLEIIQERQWTDFAKQPNPGITSVAHNVARSSEARTHVVLSTAAVDFSPKAIRAVYNLPEVDDTQYLATLETLTPDIVLQALTKPSTQWLTQTPGSSSQYFDATNLSSYGRALMYFICARIDPTSSQRSILYTHARLLYIIANNIPFDLGTYLSKSIVHCITAGKNVALNHPSLITELCRMHGVKWPLLANEICPICPITHKTIIKYERWDGAPAHPRGLGYLLDSVSQAPVDNEIANTHNEADTDKQGDTGNEGHDDIPAGDDGNTHDAQSQVQVHHLEQRITHLEEEMREGRKALRRELHQELRRMQRRADRRLAARDAYHRDYLASWTHHILHPDTDFIPPVMSPTPPTLPDDDATTA